MTGHIVGLSADGREPEPQERQRTTQLLDEDPLPRDQLGVSLRLDRPATAGRAGGRPQAPRRRLDGWKL